MVLSRPLRTDHADRINSPIHTHHRIGITDARFVHDTRLHIGRDIGAVLKNVVGGEVVSYTKLMADAREEALYRMQEDALRQGATMVVGVRFASSLITQGVSEIVAWGTAVAPEAR